MTANGQPEDYDLLILGSGAGAKLLAWTFASSFSANWCPY
jgi:hypothetical protein